MYKTCRNTTAVALIVLSFIFHGSVIAADVAVKDGAASPMLDFALFRWKKLEQESALSVERNRSLPEQGFEIQRSNVGWKVSGADDHGLMYGVLDLAESVRLKLDPVKKKSPPIHRRGLKMNIPLDARCPSYDDSGTSAIENIPVVWEMSFWEQFLDRMAEHRLNVLTLWNNHPFTTLVQLEDYPDVAIPDVAIPTYEMDPKMLIQYRKEKLQDPQHYKVVRKMTMEEKVAHWRNVMRYAKQRGIDVYFITWNIWLHGAEGKYGINDDQTNEKTIRYVRESMKQLVLTYPDLKGFGVTAGENMKNKMEGEYSPLNWLWKTYGEGISDALAEQPDRHFDFIHRVWYTGIDPMMDSFINKYPQRCDVSFKYARARLYSMEAPPFFGWKTKQNVEKNKLRCWMNLRNDDIFHFRWGNPDYVRDFLANLPKEPQLAGFYMGSDGYVWGREFISKHPQSPRQLEIDKHWYRFLMWGRLAYDPSLDRSYFEAKIQDRFPESNAAELYDAWQAASLIVPKINLFHWRDWDHMWSVETCMSKKEGYHSLNHFIEFGPFNSVGPSIPDYVENPDRDGISPPQAADELDKLALDALAAAEKLKDGTSHELRETITDFKAFAHLAHYYADKIRAALALHQFRVTGDEARRSEALHHVDNSLAHWKEYGTIASSLYETQLLARVDTTDWLGALLDYAKKDADIVRAAKHNVFPPTVVESALN